MPTNQEISNEMQKLITLGKEGKLWRIAITYNFDGATKLHVRGNMTGEQVMNFRTRMFQAGFELVVEPGHWKIVCPMDIQTVDMYRQTRFEPETQTGPARG